MKKLFVVFLLIPVSAIADMMCDINITNYYALYELNYYNCQPGQYLPANTLGCVSCPADYNCPGGTFTFNPDIPQGLDFNYLSQTNNICSSDFPNDLFAFYEPNEHTCDVGYYLPAGIDECELCPANNACVGGTYSFNKIISQGIQSCANNTYSPSGSGLCYQHILHIGEDVVYLRSEKRTTPSLNVRIGENIFYANMTTVPTHMNKDSTHYFRAEWENNDYYICDDTTYQQ